MRQANVKILGGGTRDRWHGAKTHDSTEYPLMPTSDGCPRLNCLVRKKQIFKPQQRPAKRHGPVVSTIPSDQSEHEDLNAAPISLESNPQVLEWELIKTNAALHCTKVTESESSSDWLAPDEEEGKKFSYSFGLVFSCLGCVLGTGNIWRFPRIVATASSDQGKSSKSLFHLGVALLPIRLVGPANHHGVHDWSIHPKLTSNRLSKISWIKVSVGRAYFSVVVGWCFYYFYVACAWPELPSTEPESKQIFENFIGTYWPLGLHTLDLLICGIAVFKGVKGIEIANSCMVPVQLTIVISTFYWSLSREYADVGIKFMFALDWAMLANPQVYVEAACQNAFDTAAGMGLFSAYAAYFTRQTGAVRFGTLLPMVNNLVSLICGLMLFATVFSALIQTQPTLTIPQIVTIMKESGPGSTGLTFTWIPVLMSRLGIAGRILCALFFLCLSFAGVTSMIGYIELTARTIQDFGVKRQYATIAALIVSFLVGVPSALSIDVLQNQDFVWGFALMISGLCYCVLVIRYNPVKYRRVIVNDFGLKDWKLPFIWIILIVGVVPLEAVGLICWWAYQNIAFINDWYLIRVQSLMTTFLEATGLRTGFTYSLGLIFSCLGCVLGTGNIWRFPRIIAVASSDKGCLTFILVWVVFLFTWSIPLIITEYTLGRFTRGSPVVAFYKFLGEKFFWVGSWITAIAFLISAYFSVVVGWCFYYLYVSCTWAELPSTEPESRDIFENFTRTYWPLVHHTLCLMICGITVFKGVKGIEFANSCLVPIQLIIVIIVFYWSLSREYADVGIKFMFTADWSTLLDPKIYVEAACQNAFDTAAGMGVFSAYAAYFSRNTGAVRYGILLPIFNNLVSLTCGLTIFATVFSTLIQTSPTLTIPQIVAIMKESGPGSTGLTFTWIPVLMSKLGILGRILCALFFLCLSFAGVSSMIAYVELTARTIQDFGVKRIWATVTSLIISFVVGVPSAVSVDILSNQDFVWGFGLIVSGLCYCALVVWYNPMRYLRVIINDFAINDWRLPFIWIFIIAGIVPFEGLSLIAWWVYQNIAFTKWYQIRAESLAIILIEVRTPSPFSTQ
ncbi:unnamed protein product [Taenia asiatica]|uniref:Sodium-dependent transporter n=1 Tax=Taenia asiatica TaxID=60517 RepID=A0A158R952_TAEAS|nr:unnamed protein product [Taenia asiatica]